MKSLRDETELSHGQVCRQWAIWVRLKLNDRARGDALAAAIERSDGLYRNQIETCSTLTDSHARRDELRALAVVDAHAQAVALAGATGGELGTALRIEPKAWRDGQSTECSYEEFGLPRMRAEAPAPSQWVETSVQVEYQLHDGTQAER